MYLHAAMSLGKKLQGIEIDRIRRNDTVLLAGSQTQGMPIKQPRAEEASECLVFVVVGSVTRSEQSLSEGATIGWLKCWQSSLRQSAIAIMHDDDVLALYMLLPDLNSH